MRAPRQLLLGHSFGLVPESMSRYPAWLQPLRRALRAVDVKGLFPRLDRRDGVQEDAVHQALLSDVIHGLQQGEGPVEHLFAMLATGEVLGPTTELVVHTEQEWIPLWNGG